MSFGTACTETTLCCGACEGGNCCSNQGGECETDNDCCGALDCIGAVPGVTLGECTSDLDLASIRGPGLHEAAKQFVEHRFRV